MLLWIRNLHFAGSSVDFFISGQIPVQYEATITTQYEADVIVESDGTVSV